MKIIEERMGFFNMRLVQRMNQVGISPTRLAQSIHLSYEQVRKLIMGRCLPSDATLEKLCVSLDLNKREMKGRVAKDRMVFKFGDAAWAHLGVSPRVGQLAILFPLLTKEQQEFTRLHMTAFVEAKKKRDRAA
jgi:hypothetical protein